MERSEAKRIVVVGGGYAGVAIVKDLLKAFGKYPHAEIVLVAPSDAFYHAIASPRAVADASFAELVFTPYSKCWSAGAVKHVRAVATKLLPSSLELSTGDTLQFDFAVLATGRTYSAPFRLSPGKSSEEGLRHLAELRAQIAKASKVIVVGGGATGVETAGEIKSAFPAQTVVLVHSKEHLLNTQHSVTPKKAAKLLAKLQALGVDVRLNQTFQEDEVEENAFVVWANRSTPNTAWIPQELLDKKGLVKADKYLRVEGWKNVFCAGDIVSNFEPSFKTAKFVHAPVIVSNLLAVIDGKEPKKEVGRLPGFVDDVFVAALGKHQSFSVGLLGKMFEGGKRKNFRIDQAQADLIVK